jgi:hypothetical protein
MNLKKGFRIITWVLSLIAFLSWVAFGLFGLRAGFDDWWLTIPIAFASFAGIWIIYWVIYLVCRCPARNIILWLGIIALVLMCIFPPWNKVYCLPSSNIKAYTPIGYYPLMCSPEGSVTIDFSRLFLQLFVVGVITGGLIYTFRDKKGKND